MNILHNVGLFFFFGGVGGGWGGGFPASLFFNTTGDHMDALPYSRRYTN